MSASAEVPWYRADAVATHNPIEYGGVNSTILTNAGIDIKIQNHIANAYRLIFNGQVSLFDAINQVIEQVPDSKEIQNIIKFCRETTLGIITKDR